MVTRTVLPIERKVCSVCLGKVSSSETQMRVTGINLDSGQLPEAWRLDRSLSLPEFPVAVIGDFQLPTNLVCEDLKAVSIQISNWLTSCQSAVFEKNR